MGSRYMDEGMCECGERLSMSGSDYVWIMPCCFRRIHSRCLQSWSTEMEKLHRDNRHGRVDLTRTEAEFQVHYECECGSRLPLSFKGDTITTVSFVRKKIVFETIEHIPVFDSALEVELKMIIGLDWEDRKWTIELGIEVPRPNQQRTRHGGHLREQIPAYASAEPYPSREHLLGRWPSLLTLRALGLRSGFRGQWPLWILLA